MAPGWQQSAVCFFFSVLQAERTTIVRMEIESFEIIDRALKGSGR
jgi:hypothetical protein